MRRSNQFAWVSCLLLILAGTTLVAGAFAADEDEFVPPPQAEREAVAALSKQGGSVQVDGEYRITTVLLGANTTNDDLKLLAACERLTAVRMSSPRITDAGIEHLKGLTRLTSMAIESSGLTSEGITSLRAALPNCRNWTFYGRRGGGGDPPVGVGPGGGGLGGGGPGGGGFGREGRDRSGVDATMFGAGGFGSRTSRSTLVRNTAVQDDLKLTPDQRKQISAAISTDPPDVVLRAIEQKINAALTSEQVARLKQIELQQAGVPGLLREETAKELKLTDDQKTSINKLRVEAAASLRTAMSELTGQRAPGSAAAELTAKLREKMVEVNKARDEMMLAVLSEEQRKAWQSMLGPKGPEISTNSDRFGGFASSSLAEMAKSVFDRYDSDRNGTLTDAEFPESNRTRRSLTTSGVTLQFPVAREDFEKMYIKYLEGMRGGR